ncbi:hydroxyphenylacetyl-CoA thioesterase PaaI [Motiliproteus sp. MSK22-1]|uniref:hydroxyphenylacetyl-CoA thioesterase PaaI n=1 Tax=Motiliproteus sp. MSK22-1 TaxID=1897630 RepID=UPI000975B41A|nr:hydroxyphenylacetyl-CoA thioesterase PaaI [Motiliproteus sp. MSK22-1]OMH38339.1 phenylacetic acid degradation protein PaaD [Motiliproteus sp. MSK22-1]
MNDLSLTGVEAKKLAERCADELYKNDSATRKLGMEIVRIEPGYAELTLPITEWMVNGHQTCHGGMIFTLADSAFAFACNSENQKTVASGCNIDYLSPGRIGDLLTAKAEKQYHRGRTGVYDVRVENQHGDLVALFRGKAYRLSGNILDD